MRGLRGSMQRAQVMALAWTGIIVLCGVFPLSNFVGHAHWEFIKWLPTIDDLRSPKYLLDIAIDLVVNTLLFVPFGYFFAASTVQYGKHAIWMIVGTAAILSCSIEFFQVYSHNRFPSVLDVITNVSGGLIGAAMLDRSRVSPQKAPTAAATPTQPDRTLAP